MASPKVLSLEWVGKEDGYLRLLDQTLLPCEVRYLECRDAAVVWEAIRQLRVRGAPAIGIAAAYGLYLGVREPAGDDGADFLREVDRAADYLAGSRPTAINLFWALNRMQRRARDLAAAGKAPREIASALLAEARAIHDEDRRLCHAIGRHGASLLKDGDGVLTHCNAGGLATSEYGTALAAIYAAVESGKRIHVYADETRPLLQGARLTAWELQANGVPVTLLCDNMAAQVLREGRVQAVIVGADRIAANGDAANKIGTYGVAVLAAHHGVPFYVAAPRTTFDLTLADGSGIPIEQRDAREVTHGFGRQTAPDGVEVYNPAFDVTPAELIRGIIFEGGIISPVNAETVGRALGG
ncbi:S-methyl-5-thioribose-1-phosphate isomerase [Thermopirellula anaerolimosa]